MRRIRIFGRQQFPQAVLGDREWRARDLDAGRPQSRRADRDQRGLHGFAARVEVAETLFDEVGARQPGEIHLLIVDRARQTSDAGLRTAPRIGPISRKRGTRRC